MAIKPPQPSMFTGPGPEDPSGGPPGWGYPSGTPSGMNCWREVEMLLKYKCKGRGRVTTVAGGWRPSRKKGNIVKIEGFITVSCKCRESMNLPTPRPAPGSFGRLYVDVKPQCALGGWRWVKVKQRTNMGPCNDIDGDGTYDDCMGGSGIFIDEEIELPFKAGDVIPGMGAGGGSTGTEADHCDPPPARLGRRRNSSKPISKDVADCMNDKFCICYYDPTIGPSAGEVNNMQNEQIEKMIDRLLRKVITDEDCRPGGTGSA